MPDTATAGLPPETAAGTLGQQLAARMAERIRRGALIMAGGATAAEALRPGLHVSCRVGSGRAALGSVSFSIANKESVA